MISLIKKVDQNYFICRNEVVLFFDLYSCLVSFNRLFPSSIYRKIPVISPGLIQLRKGFWVGLQTEGLISGGLISGTKKHFEMSHSSVDGNTFLIY